uniref:MADF domain-containing protein n=1 Tax=Clastoptera arizonana TaxID=38151 RepID=A0A1B6DD16_9HEMI
MPMDIKKEPLDSDSIVQCLIDIKEEPFHLDLKDECVMEIKKEVFDSDLKDECLMDIKKEAIDLDSMDECLIDIPTRNASEGPETDPLEEVEMKEEIFEVRGDSGMEWPNELVLEFLEFYENEPIIWNSSLSNHKNRIEIYDAWKRIEIKMGNKFSIAELKKKKDSLMASFRACVKKVKECNKSGAGSDEIHKPSWFAYDRMERFLRDRTKPRETFSTEDNLTQQEHAEQPQHLPENQVLEDNDKCEAIILPMYGSPSLKPLPRKMLKTADDREIRKKIDGAYATLLSKVAASKERSLCDIYGELVAAKLKAMDEDSRDICMHRIDNILFEMKMSKTCHQLTK